MILFSIIISIFLSTASFAWGYFQAGFENIAKYIIVFGILWLISRWRKWRWFSSLALFISLFLSIFGLWFDLPLVWMFSGAIFALIAWDLNQFQEKLSLLPDREDKKGMTRRRLIRISILALVGLTIAFAIEYL
ncbi:MAG: hypothetical protein JNJ43_18400, partial [Anaerolineales bacterium]|nr:hypothetical protein [Anaerolineales bacterium]